MPLVVPGINVPLTNHNNNNNNRNEWLTKLVGKKLTESTSDELVSNSGLESYTGWRK